MKNTAQNHYVESTREQSCVKLAPDNTALLLMHTVKSDLNQAGRARLTSGRWPTLGGSQENRQKRGQLSDIRVF